MANQTYKRVAVEVTKDDIRRGQGHSNDPWACPVARALKRTFHTYRVVVASDTRIREYEFPTPRVVSRWIRQFDLGHAVEPFRFTVKVPR